MTLTDSRGVQAAAGSAIAPRLLAVWMVWGSTYLGLAVLVRTLPPLLANGMRFLIASLILAALISVLRGPGSLRVTLRQLRGAATLGVALLGVGIGTVSMAERFVPSGIAALLVSVMPLWIILFRFSAGDRPSRLTLAGIFIGIGGLVAMMLPGGTHPIAGDESDVIWWMVAILCSSFCWAFFSWRSTKFTLPKDPLTTSVYEMAAAGLVLTIVGSLMGQRIDPTTVSRSSWIALVYLIAASIIAYTAYVWLLDNAPISLVATYAYVNPVVAVFLGWLIVGEPITLDVIIGLTIVVGGVILVVSGERKPVLIEEPS